MSSTETAIPTSIDATLDLLRAADYVGDRALATILHLSLKMQRPIFLEGEAGVGKTEIAKVLAVTLNRPLIRLQCYEGLDVSTAVYEWNYLAQMIEIRMAEAAGDFDRENLSRSIYSDRFLIKRPLLQAIENNGTRPPVLLIDELDRADEAFEAYLLEVLSDSQITIPELGTVKGEPPIVVITTNRTREIHDALKRRCLYHWVDYPDADSELEIVRLKVPGAAERLTSQIVAFVQKLRADDQLFKAPGVAETIDWATALNELNILALDPGSISDTLGVLLKYQDDIQHIEGSTVKRLIDEIKAEPEMAGK